MCKEKKFVKLEEYIKLNSMHGFQINRFHGNP